MADVENLQASSNVLDEYHAVTGTIADASAIAHTWTDLVAPAGEGHGLAFKDLAGDWISNVDPMPTAASGGDGQWLNLADGGVSTVNVGDDLSTVNWDIMNSLPW